MNRCIFMSVTFFAIRRYCVATGLQPGNIKDLWSGLGYLLIGVIAINIPTFKKMSRSVELRSQNEAAFKFVHSRIRLHAETIALYAAEDVEISEVSRAFESVVSSSKIVIAWQSLFQGLQIAFQLVPSIVAGTRASSTRAQTMLDFLRSPLSCVIQVHNFLTRFRFCLCLSNCPNCNRSILGAQPL
jgi:ABC-type uncharacterized transport system fused permease/ATPase subunit